MLVFRDKDKVCCYVHLPKCAGRYIKQQVRSQYEMIKNFCGIDKKTTKNHGYDNFMDRMHIPINLFTEYFFKDKIDQFFTYTRNPYHRLISGYYFTKQKQTFEDFVLTTLKNQNVFEYHRGYVHFLSQCYYLNKNESIHASNVMINSLENYELGNIRLNNFNLKSYDLSRFYNKEMLKVVNEKYQKDFELLNYPFIEL